MTEKKRGRPTESKKDELIKIRISKSEKENIIRFCKSNNISNVSELVRLSIDAYINKK